MKNFLIRSLIASAIATATLSVLGIKLPVPIPIINVRKKPVFNNTKFAIKPGRGLKNLNLRRF